MPPLVLCRDMCGFCLKAASGCGVKWSMDSAPTLSATETVSAKLQMILRGILTVLGTWRVEPMRAMVLYNRISGTFGRIERMLMRFRAGRLWCVKQRAQGQKQCGRVAGRGPALPRKFGWLVQAGGYQAAGFGLQLQTVLNTPEMSALLAASPEGQGGFCGLCVGRWRWRCRGFRRLRASGRGTRGQSARAECCPGRDGKVLENFARGWRGEAF